MRGAIRLRTMAWGAALAVLTITGAQSAEAGVLLCPGMLEPGVTRQVEFNWDDAANPGGVAECEDYGTGNLGPGGFENVTVTYDGQDFPWIEKDDSGQANNGGILNIDIGAESGSFSFTQPGDYLLGLKFGNGSGDPDWIIVQLTNINSGTFEWTNGANALSHALAWGTPGDRTVPEPSALLLLGGGAAAAALRRRFRQA